MLMMPSSWPCTWNDFCSGEGLIVSIYSKSNIPLSLLYSQDSTICWFSTSSTSTSSYSISSCCFSQRNSFGSSSKFSLSSSWMRLELFWSVSNTICSTSISIGRFSMSSSITSPTSSIIFSSTYSIFWSTMSPGWLLMISDDSNESSSGSKSDRLS